MRPPLRTTSLVPMVVLIVLAIGGWATHNKLAAVATLAVVASILWPILSDLGARIVSPHVVYQLHNDTHSVIYVGETNRTIDRMYEHTDGTEHDWHADIYGYTIARHCWSDRQARRIERRRITVINACSGPGLLGEFCDPLRNEIYDDDHHELATKLWLLFWKPVYLVASLTFDSCAFHAPADRTHPIPTRPDPDYDPARDPWRDGDTPEGDTPTATYHRPPSAPPQMRMLALPPADRNEDRYDQDRNDDPPLRSRGDSPPPPTRNDRVTPNERRSITTLIRDAEAQRTRTVDVAASEGAATPPVSRASRRRVSSAKSNAQRQFEYREREKARRAAVEGRSYTARVWPGDGPATDPAEGGGVGEGAS